MCQVVLPQPVNGPHFNITSPAGYYGIGYKALLLFNLAVLRYRLRCFNLLLHGFLPNVPGQVVKVRRVLWPVFAKVGNGQQSANG